MGQTWAPLSVLLIYRMICAEHLSKFVSSMSFGKCASDVHEAVHLRASGLCAQHAAGGVGLESCPAPHSALCFQLQALSHLHCIAHLDISL